MCQIKTLKYLAVFNFLNCIHSFDVFLGLCVHSLQVCSCLLISDEMILSVVPVG